jgi:hypothetical protein
MRGAIVYDSTSSSGHSSHLVFVTSSLQRGVTAVVLSPEVGAAKKQGLGSLLQAHHAAHVRRSVARRLARHVRRDADRQQVLQHPAVVPRVEDNVPQDAAALRVEGGVEQPPRAVDEDDVLVVGDGERGGEERGDDLAELLPVGGQTRFEQVRSVVRCSG